jgi:hypothetical protein
MLRDLALNGVFGIYPEMAMGISALGISGDHKHLLVLWLKNPALDSLDH